MPWHLYPDWQIKLIIFIIFNLLIVCTLSLILFLIWNVVASQWAELIAGVFCWVWWHVLCRKGSATSIVSSSSEAVAPGTFKPAIRTPLSTRPASFDLTALSSFMMDNVLDECCESAQDDLDYQQLWKAFQCQFRIDVDHVQHIPTKQFAQLEPCAKTWQLVGIEGDEPFFFAQGKDASPIMMSSAFPLLDWQQMLYGESTGQSKQTPEIYSV